MYTTKSLELVTKASEILGLIYKANDRIDELEQKIYEYEHTSGLFSEVRLFERLDLLKNQRATTYRAKERLVKHYGNIVLRIIYNGLKQGVFEHLDAPSVTLKP